MEGDNGPAQVRSSRAFDRVQGAAALVFLFPNLALPVNGCPEVAGKCIHHGDTYPVQPPGYLIGVLVELTPGTDLGHDDLQGGNAFLFVQVHGYPAAIVLYGYRIILVDGNGNGITVAAHGFVDGVVDDLVHQVVQAADPYIADIHRRTHAHVFDAFQRLYTVCRITFSFYFFTHY